MKTNRYNVDYFIRKFSRIPKNKWTSGSFKDSRGRCCATGHCGVIKDNLRYITHNKEAMSLYNLFQDYLRVAVETVNDGDSLRFQQATPKSRILAALKLIKQKQKI